MFGDILHRAFPVGSEILVVGSRPRLHLCWPRVRLTVALRRSVFPPWRQENDLLGDRDLRPVELFERLRRLMISDLFTFALAGLFPSTIFGSNMAPPWSFLQDASSFFFGNDEDKDRAFFGSLPYPLNIIQPVSPPITRLLYPTFQAAVSGNWDRCFDYHVRTWFPYGRMANSVRKTMQDPSMAVEQFTGLPLHRLASDVKKKDQDRVTTEGIISGLL